MRVHGMCARLGAVRDRWSWRGGLCLLVQHLPLALLLAGVVWVVAAAEVVTFDTASATLTAPQLATLLRHALLPVMVVGGLLFLPLVLACPFHEVARGWPHLRRSLCTVVLVMLAFWGGVWVATLGYTGALGETAPLVLERSR